LSRPACRLFVSFLGVVYNEVAEPPLISLFEDEVKA
jgi:hypothetical protein